MGQFSNSKARKADRKGAVSASFFLWGASKNLSNLVTMKRNRPIIPDYLAGKWQITAFYLCTDIGWKLTKKYVPNSFVWEFCSGGVLIEIRKGRPLFQTTFAFSADTKELIIDRAGFDKEDALCFNGYYEVESINDNECLIYDLESKSENPGICKYRMKIRKMH